MLFRELRTKALLLANKHINRYTKKYPPKVLALQMKCSELNKYSGEPLEDTECQALKEINFDAISECETTEDVDNLVTGLSIYLENYPEIKEAGYRRLLEVLENEIIGLYAGTVLQTQAGWTESYILDLLNTVKYMLYVGYPLSLLFYDSSKGVFEIITAGNLICETDTTTFYIKMEVMRRTIENMAPEVLEDYIMELNTEIPLALIEVLVDNIGGEDFLPDEIRFLLKCLKEISDGSVLATPFDKDNRVGLGLHEAMLSAHHMIHCLCVHRDLVYLENDWQEFLNCAAESQRYVGELHDMVQAAISTRLLSTLTELSKTPLPETLMCLFRLYTALTLAPRKTDGFSGWVLTGI